MLIPSGMKGELLRHWEIQERLLQSYRFMFMTSQSVLLTGAALITVQGTPHRLVFLLLLVIGFVLLYAWVNITHARALDVSYFQMQLMLAEEGQIMDNVLTNFKTWQHLSRAKKQNALDKARLLRSRTRQLLQIYVPLFFGLIWIVLAAVNFLIL